MNPFGLSNSPGAADGCRGFTLAELAIVLLIVGLLLAGFLTPLATQVDLQRISQTQKMLDEAKEALIGYAASHRATSTGKPYLPCPDTNLDGAEESRTAGICPFQEGWVPWATLGIGQADGWGSHIRYRVHPNFSDGVNGFDLSTSLTTPYEIRVCGTSACSTLVARNLAAVLVSHGKNGLGARNSSNVLDPPPTSADELANTDGRNSTDTADTSVATSSYDFVSRPATAAGTTAGEFDDVVNWLSSNILFGKMVAAGRLP